jgi:hypothetical protein
MIRNLVCLSAGPSVCLFVCPSVCLSICLSVLQSACLFVCPSVCLFVCLSFCLNVTFAPGPLWRRRCSGWLCSWTCRCRAVSKSPRPGSSGSALPAETEIKGLSGKVYLHGKWKFCRATQLEKIISLSHDVARHNYHLSCKYPFRDADSVTRSLIRTKKSSLR